MFRDIVSTFGTKLLSAVLSFVVIVFTTQYLGAAGRGTISILITSITIIFLINNFVGGGTLVYLVPRHNLLQLLIPSYFWAVVLCTITYTVFSLTHIVPADLITDICLLSFIISIFSINLMVFLGKQNIRANNVISLLQIFIHVTVIAFCFIGIDNATISSFILSLYISYIIAGFLSFILLKKYFTLAGLKNSIGVIKELLRNGFWAQCANLSQFFNYRLSYYLLNFFAGAAFVGVYSVGVSLSEAIWLISNSIALVLYSKISNTKGIEYSREITIILARVSLSATILAVILLVGLPSYVYTFVFGEEFIEVTKVIFYSSPGIIAIGVSVILSHYFGGLGNYKINAKTSFAGLVVTVVLGVWLIPEYNYVGASITASASYIVTAAGLFIAFVKESKVLISQFIPRYHDFIFFFKELKKQYVRNSRNS